ncbi:MAG: hypothetical protein J0L75_18530 [Spirochaetes bacterium]|nr:hypothetical protein [Spirochaetota bacterium]
MRASSLFPALLLATMAFSQENRTPANIDLPVLPIQPSDFERFFKSGNLDANKPEGALGLSYLHFQKADYPAAISQLEKFYVAFPKKSELAHAVSLMAHSYLASGDSAKAQEEFRRFATNGSWKGHPLQTPSLLGLGATLAPTDAGRAISYLTRALSNAGAKSFWTIPARLYLGDAYRRGKEYDRSVAHLLWVATNRVNSNAQWSFTAAWRLAQAYQERGSASDAVTWYRKVSVRPDAGAFKQEALTLVATLSDELGNKDDSTVAWKELVAQFPAAEAATKGRYLLGQRARQANQSDEVLTWWLPLTEDAHKGKPWRYEVLSAILKIHADRKDPAKQIGLSEAILSEFSSGSTPQGAAAGWRKTLLDDIYRLSSEAGDVEKQLRTGETLLSEFSESGAAWRRSILETAFRIYGERGEASKRADTAVRILAEFPDSSVVATVLPDLLYGNWRAQDYDGAAKIARKILAAPAWDGEAKREAAKYLIIIYERMKNDGAQAIEGYEAYFATNPPSSLDRLVVIRDYVSLLKKLGKQDSLRKGYEMLYVDARNPDEQHNTAYNLGMLLVDSDPIRAAALLEEAAARKPDSKNSVPALTTRMRLLAKNGRAEEAVYGAGKIVRAYPERKDLAAAILDLSKILEGAGQKAEAVKALKLLKSSFPASSESAQADEALSRLK